MIFWKHVGINFLVGLNIPCFGVIASKNPIVDCLMGAGQRKSLLVLGMISTILMEMRFAMGAEIA